MTLTSSNRSTTEEIQADFEEFRSDLDNRSSRRRQTNNVQIGKTNISIQIGDVDNSDSDYYLEGDYYSDSDYYSGGDYYSDSDYYLDGDYYSDSDYYSSGDYYSDYDYYSGGDYYSDYDYYSGGDYDSITDYPKIKKANIEGNTITLTLDSQLDDSIKVDPDFFEVRSGRKKVKIKEINTIGRTGKLTLLLNKTLDVNDKVSISYNDLKGDQSQGVVQDVDGLDLQSFEDYLVENTTVREDTPLSILFAEVDDDKVYLSFERELDDVQPAPGIFRVTVDGKNNRVQDIELNSANREAILTLKRPVRFDSKASISYTDAKRDQADNVIQDLDGNDLATFDIPLENVTVEESDLQLVDGEVQDDVITLSFNETLGNSTPSSKMFTVKVNNKKTSLASNTRLFEEEGYFNLFLNKPVKADDDVIISYKDLNGNQSKGVIEDKNGNDLESFSRLKLDNVSADEMPPQLEDAYIEDGQLFLDFDELIQPGKIKGSRIKLYLGNKKYKVETTNLIEADTEISFDLKKILPTDAREVTLQYKDPNKDQSTGVIQDLFGNDLLKINGFSVDI